MRHLILAGFMATGKSTVGRLVAARLGRTLLDTDGWIVENVLGETIAEAFERGGEEGFRRAESELCRGFAALPPAVIATGGGTLIPGCNARAARAAGQVLVLTARVDTLERRQAGDAARPLLAGDWRGLLAARRDAYARLGPQIATDDLTPEGVADRVLLAWTRALESHPSRGGVP